MALGAVFGALNSMYTAVSGRTVEIATLRVLGFGATPVVVSVFAEALLLAAAGRSTRSLPGVAALRRSRDEHERCRRDAARRSTGRRTTYHRARRPLGLRHRNDRSVPSRRSSAARSATGGGSAWRPEPIVQTASMTALIAIAVVGLRTPLLDLSDRWVGRDTPSVRSGPPSSTCTCPGCRPSPRPCCCTEPPWASRTCLARLRQASPLELRSARAGSRCASSSPDSCSACHSALPPTSRRSPRSRIPVSSVGLRVGPGRHPAAARDQLGLRLHDLARALFRRPGPAAVPVGGAAAIGACARAAACGVAPAEVAAQPALPVQCAQHRAFAHRRRSPAGAGCRDAAGEHAALHADLRAGRARLPSSRSSRSCRTTSGSSRCVSRID